MRIEYWPRERLKPYEANPRKNDRAIPKMIASIREYGFTVPVLARSDGDLIDGHLRLKAADKLGIRNIPVIPCDGWSEAQIIAFRLLVNRSVEWAAWDESLLRTEFGKLAALNFDVTLTGFDAKEVAGFTVQTSAADNVLPETPALATSQAGDIWILGVHRVMCGSCLDPDAVTKLLNSRKPTLMITDPPYGIKLEMEWRDRLGHNSLAPAAGSYMQGKDDKSFDVVADYSPAYELVPSIEVAYVWHAAAMTVPVFLGLERIGLIPKQQIIWQKTVAGLSRGNYQWIHEPCWYAVRKGKRSNFVGGFGETTIWPAASPKHIMSGSKEERLPHPTQKPIELMVRSVVNHGKTGDQVYEPFGGSGTTLAACEKTGRFNCSMELEPRFVDVIVMRWQKMTGRTAVLAGDNRSFDVIREERAARPAAENPVPAQEQTTT